MFRRLLEELVRKYNWTGTRSRGAYFISSTASHYDRALKTIKPLVYKHLGGVGFQASNQKVRPVIFELRVP
ncbi:ClbS/DfsB family four-helix bundle protein [Breznakiellaceae bacterium SP9]